MIFKHFLFFIIVISSTLVLIEASIDDEEPGAAIFSINQKKNMSEMAIALSEISRGIEAAKTITLLNVDNRKSSAFDEFIMEIHRLQLETCIFNETEKFFSFVEENLKGSIEVTVLIFHDPEELIDEVKLSGKISIKNFKILSTDSQPKSGTSLESLHFLLECKTFASRVL